MMKLTKVSSFSKELLNFHRPGPFFLFSNFKKSLMALRSGAISVLISAVLCCFIFFTSEVFLISFGRLLYNFAPRKANDC